MADIFRKSALDKLQSPDQLDKAIQVTTPFSWLALGGVTLILFVVSLWAFFGTLPTTITTKGIIAAPISTNAIYASETGVVNRISVVAGQNVQVGDEIMVLRTSAGHRKIILSTQNGSVSEILVKNDDQVYQGSELVRISPHVSSNQVVVCYVPFTHAPQLSIGMDLTLTPETVDKQMYGHMLGKIINIDSYAATTTNMSYVLGSGNLLADSFSKDGAVVAVTCALMEDASTVSGYYWSSSKGKKLEIANGTQVMAKVYIERNAPITKLFIKMKELWEG